MLKCLQIKMNLQTISKLSQKYVVSSDDQTFLMAWLEVLSRSNKIQIQPTLAGQFFSIRFFTQSYAFAMTILVFFFQRGF